MARICKTVNYILSIFVALNHIYKSMRQHKIFIKIFKVEKMTSVCTVKHTEALFYNFCLLKTRSNNEM